jgi:hypothetical protein
MIMRASLKFLALLALPFVGLVANASPTPDTRLDVSIAVTEHDESSALSGNSPINCYFN